MTEERKTEVIVGLVVTCALLILILSIVWSKGKAFTFLRVVFSVRFEDVRGLEEGDPVLIRGVKQGEVERIDLGSGYAEVRLWVRDDAPMYSDLKVAVEMEELMGGKQIIIDPGTSGLPADPDKTVIGDGRGDAMALIRRAGEILARTDTVLQHLSTFMDSDRFSRVLQNMEETTGQAKTILAENRQDFRMAVERLEAMTRALHDDSTAYRFGTVVNHLDSTVLLVKQVALRMESQEGTVGKLLGDRQLYDRLLKTTAGLDSLITDIKANPKKYVHVSVF